MASGLPSPKSSLEEETPNITPTVPRDEEAAETSKVKDVPELEPFRTSTSTLAADYSDVPSNDAEESSKQRRKYQRGGRKKKYDEEQNLQSVSEANLLNENENENDGDKEVAAKPTRPKSKRRESKRSGSKPPFDTGIRAFNLKRAESSGGRPFGLSIPGSDKPRSKSKSKPKSKPKPKSRRRKSKEPEEGEEKENWESEASEEESEEESEQEKEKEEEKPKPFSIRLDLNIELEIFLRAKIKGDVTITFLQ
ncbi:hypothetical protein LSUE1_G000635 [Lachnellula suecica]|uniref:Uncharacterized protein n=1 Tax=Lachnellula suecica TaxID=602035 RepID=A0A8T9CKS6_9HELO|nr:hypothetical protein LSUE1_G000635 [Lachnellula suecica]